MSAISPFLRPFYAMLKPAGAACNLSCRYCYYTEKAALYPGATRVMDDALLDRIESFAAAAQAHGKSMAQYAIRWTLEQPAVVSAIVGVKNEKQVDDAVAALA